jgi:putative flavoprotein involved in K+ transport
MWWLDHAGIFSERVEDLVSIEASRAQPSLQLVGRPDHRSLDLGTLQAAGVRLVGRAEGVEGSAIRFADDLADSVDAAQAKLHRVLARIDAFVEDRGLEAPDPRLPARIEVAPPPRRIDLGAEKIRTVLWATGYRRTYPFLKGSLVGILDRRGELRHVGGVTPMPGLYALGLFLQRRRNSSFIDGVGEDARELADRILARLHRSPAVAA